MLNRRAIYIVLCFGIILFFLQGCRISDPTGRAASRNFATSSNGEEVIIDKHDSISLDCSPTLSGACGEKKESTKITSILTAKNDALGYGTYIYLIITDMTKNREQIRAAADVFACNFDSAKIISHKSKETALFVAKTKPTFEGEIYNGRDLVTNYSRSIAAQVHGNLVEMHKTLLQPMNGFSANSSLYLLGSPRPLGLYLEREDLISENMKMIGRGSTPIEIVDLESFTPREIATLMENLRKMYFDINIKEESSFLHISKLRETRVKTFLRTVLRYIPLPISSAHATGFEICP
tara:strand:- start:5908 stop:6789 length:882 start_codon:yes stop_codon:yes gene_type:complete